MYASLNFLQLSLPNINYLKDHFITDEHYLQLEHLKGKQKVIWIVSCQSLMGGKTDYVN